MGKIQIMFSSRPKLLSEVIRNLIERQSDMRVVGEVIDPIELIFALRSTPVDVVIISPVEAKGDPRICSQLLKEHPQLRILILTERSGIAYIYQTGRVRERFEKPSEDTILSAIRQSKTTQQERMPDYER